MSEDACTVKGPVHVELVDPTSGDRFELDVPKGTFKPKNERETFVLQRLIAKGLATGKDA